jgi:hypothetical protein
MNRKAYFSSFSLILICLAVGLLTSCSSSSHTSGGGGTTPPNTTPSAVAATTGSGQSVTVGGTYSALSATVTNSANAPLSGVSVTFTVVPGTSGATASFPAGATTDTETTNSNGVATTSLALTAGTTAGGFTITATVSGVTTPGTFTETNTTATVASNTYVFYASGQELINNGPNYYAVAGAVTIDANGNVLGGVQDYNDAFGFTFFDQIGQTTGALVAVPSTTGLYTLTIDVSASDTSIGVAGIETFAVQFININHALITQFDGSATSSGSLDLQTTTSAANGNYAFTAVGVDNNSTVNPYASVAIGGVVTATSGNLSGTYDINDSNNGNPPSAGNSITAGATLSATDTYGRGTLNGSGLITSGSTFAFYVVGPATGSQALRLIDVDANDVAIGSAYGQGAATFTNASFPSPTPSVTSGVFTLLGQWSQNYATLGEFTTDSNGNITGGEADDNELDIGLQQEGVLIAGSTYDLITSGINGYGSMSMTGTGDVTTLGLYMVDPALNINDPNNTTSADVGGALIIDLDGVLPGGSGIITPQTDTTVADFNGTYVAGFQDFNGFNGSCLCEFDMISQGTMTTGAALSLTGADSDPFGTVSGAESTGDRFSATPAADGTGIYTMSLSGIINGNTGSLDVDIYQASATTLYWLNWDSNSVFLGPIVTQAADLTGIPGAKKPAAKPQSNRNQNTQPKKGFGSGTFRW